MNIEPTELYIERNEEIRRTKEALQNQMQCVGELKEYLHNAQQMIDALKQQVEDMQRCGNCKLFLRGNCPKKEEVNMEESKNECISESVWRINDGRKRS